MSEFAVGRNDSLSLLIAGRGDESPGLFSAERSPEGSWRVQMLDVVPDLAALSSHPKLPLVYGISGSRGGTLVTWRIGGSGVSRVGELESNCAMACDIAVSPDGQTLVVTDFGRDGDAGSLRIWQLPHDGVPNGPGVPIAMDAQEARFDSEQAVPHPHQAVFLGEEILVPDLGRDVVRRFTFGEAGLTERQSVHVAVGTGPRHIAAIPGSAELLQVVVSGEIASTVLLGDLGNDVPNWRVSPSSRREDVARTRSNRNYPGDIKASSDGKNAYVTNRGHDTLTTLAISVDAVEIVTESLLPVRWPQHLFLTEAEIFVAGWDSSEVAVAKLERGVPATFEIAFSCPGAAWIIRNPEPEFNQ